MDAKQLGPFIAERRKELGMTQAVLAEKLHVTDKAVSRWERGIGLPDINSVEALANALEVSLVEFMQAQRNEKEKISTKEAEKLLADTIQLSRTANNITKSIGGAILLLFVIISLLLLYLFISNGKIVMYSVGSIITGLIAWGIPIWQISLAKNKKIIITTVSSLGFALVSLTIQFFDIARMAHIEDWSSIRDTIDVLSMVVVLFSTVTLLLNIIIGKKVCFAHSRGQKL